MATKNPPGWAVLPRLHNAASKNEKVEKKDFIHVNDSASESISNGYFECLMKDFEQQVLLSRGKWHVGEGNNEGNEGKLSQE